MTYSVRYIHRDSTGGTSTVPVHITDSLQTPDFTYDQSSFLLYKVKWRYGTDGKWTYNDENNHGTYKYVQPSDYTLTWGSDDKSFDLKFTAQDLKDLDGYVLFYGLLYKGKPVNKITDATLKPANGTIIRNTATLELPNTTPISYPQTMVVKGSDGTIHFKRFTLQVNKTDQNGTPLNGVTFQLWDKKTNTLVDTQTTQTTGGGQGIAIFNNLLYGTYTLKETDAPFGYAKAADKDITIDESNATDETKPVSVTVTDSLLPVTVTKTVKKVWKDSDDKAKKRPTSINVELLANGQPTGKKVTLNETNHWTDHIDNLDKYDSNNQEIKYTWQEDKVTDYNPVYTTSTDGNTTIITNTYAPTTTSKTVKKVWSGDSAATKHDEITVELLDKDNKVVQTVKLSDKNNWTATVDGLTKGESYTWKEINVPAGYVSSQTTEGNTTTITNTRKQTPPTSTTIDKTVTKVWNDGNNQDGLRPSSITVNLLKNGQVYQTFTLNAGNNWTATTIDLPDGNTYTWEEASVPAGYTAKVDGDTITNTHTPATISKTVTKVWNDGNNQDGIRPTSITVNLLRNGEIYKTVTLSAANNWTDTETGLDKYADGKEITYTWQEADVPAGYTSSSTSAGDATTIINTHTHKPKKPDVPKTPKAPNTPKVPKQPRKTGSTERKQQKLPQTGSNDALALLALGFMTLSMMLGAAIRRDY